ncbi:MAG: arabinofuranosyltransferase [Deltaproteobacteria bacterium]|nr:arabinofuranosyltransferase [Deltaproteobacteria bacterium]
MNAINQKILRNYFKNADLKLYLIIYFFFGIYLFNYTYSAKPYSETQIIWDMIWLDAWALALFFIVVAIWSSDNSKNTKYILSLLGLSCFGFIAVNLFFDGTPFGLNGYWGDQKFRLAMIQKFISFGWYTDFYYKDQPPFYPPLYYYILAMYARLFSIEAYKMLKIGSMLTYSIGPIFLYFIWKKIVTPFRAFFITIAAFIVCDFGRPFQFFSPPAFLANLLFIPWWLYYIERVKNPDGNWKYYFWGGLSGAAIFMIYFYPFFIGGLLILGRVTLFRRCPFIKRTKYFSLSRALGILCISALFSIPYWIPVFISILINGFDRSRGGWHHIGSAGFGYSFLEFSIIGLLFLISILYMVRRRKSLLLNSLLLIIGTSIFYHLVASVLGGIGRPLNLAKSLHFVEMMSGTFIGILFADALRLGRSSRRMRGVLLVLLAAISLFALNNFNGLIKHDWVKTSRTSTVPTWNTDITEMHKRKGSVFLCGHEEFMSFYPVYTFIAANEHYSHPASRFKERYDFLYLLQAIDDPYIFNLALRQNVYDPVDYFMPRKGDNKFEISVSLSNYPNRFITKKLQYSMTVVSDTALFEREKGDNLYAVKPAIFPSSNNKFSYGRTSGRDSLLVVDRLMRLRNMLDSTGKSMLDEYCNLNPERRYSILGLGHPIDFDNQIALLSGSIFQTRDSTFFILLFSSRSERLQNYKIFLHRYDLEGNKVNFDFMPNPRTHTWNQWDQYLCCRAFPRECDRFRYSLGFFNRDGRLGHPLNGQFDNKSLDYH